MEGLFLASNIQGSHADALVAMFKSKTIDEVMKWVDDFVFFCTLIDQPNPSPTLMPDQSIWLQFIVNTLNIQISGCTLASH